MDVDGAANGHPQRSLSQTSTASARSHRSRSSRPKPRNSNASSSTNTISDKSLTSFPSLSPENSPEVPRRNDVTPKALEPSAKGAKPQKDTPQRKSIVAGLVKSSPSLRGRSALFQDVPSGSNQVPGTLHLASDEHIERLLARTGAVKLVRQLAEDLAHRDAEISSLRSRADRRERELKKMLREVEVSNLDIEKRLYHMESAKENGNGVDEGSVNGLGASRVVGGIDQMMNQAMSDDVGYVSDGDDDDDKKATLKPSKIRSGDNSDTNSITESVDSTTKGTASTKGWQNYLWGGTLGSRKTSRASSIISEEDERLSDLPKSRAPSAVPSKRRGLESNLFEPPSESSNKSTTSEAALSRPEQASPEHHVRKTSASVSSWAVKLFAGNSTNGKENDGKKSIRGRSSTTGQGDRKDHRTASMASSKTAVSAKAALLRISGQRPGGSISARTKSNMGPNGTIKARRDLSPSNFPPGSPATVHSINSAAANLGPVEMDRILPPDTRPPSLNDMYNLYHPTEFLTDKFGFIYDQRRKKRQKEAAESERRIKHSSGIETIGSTRDLDDSDAEGASPNTQRTRGTSSPASSFKRPETPVSLEEREEEQPTKKWTDYLKLATRPAELLSHTPSAAPVMTLMTADEEGRKRTSSAAKRLSIPSAANPEPSSTNVLANSPEFSQMSTTEKAASIVSNSSEQEPVKLLLDQLTELHDSNQQERMLKWNEFMRRVRAERKREGDVAASEGRTGISLMPETSLADGEMVGVSGLGLKGKIGRAKWKDFKSLILGGVPVALRAKVWSEGSGALALQVPGYYDDLVNSEDTDPTLATQIRMDINRTLTDNVFFRKGPGVAKLEEILLAYSRRNPSVGYCQGMNLITASLLLIMPSAEDAFWILASMIESILPQHYYDQSLLTSRADQQVLRKYVAEILPNLSNHLEELGIELEALTFQWFLSVFTDCLSAEALYRVWDVVLCMNDGSTFLFQVALALLKLNEKALIACDNPAAVYTYINHSMTNHAISIDGLIQASDALKKVVRRAEVEERRANAVEAEKENMRQRELARSARWSKAQAKSTAPPEGGGKSPPQMAEDRDVGDENEELAMQSPKPMEEESRLS